MGKISSRYDGKPADEPTRTPDEPPDPDEIVVDGLRIWMRECKRQLPAPCPTDFADCAAWWRTQMQEPEKRHETFLRSGGHGGQVSNWDCGYAVRLRSSLLMFLALTDAERSLIVSAREDGIFWRGEPVAHFLGVIEETENMRQVGVPAYRQQAIANLKTAFSRIGQRGEAANSETRRLQAREQNKAPAPGARRCRDLPGLPENDG